MRENIYLALRAINAAGLDASDWGLTDYIEGLGSRDYFGTVYEVPLIGRYLYVYLDMSRDDYSAIINSSPRFCLNLQDQPSWQVLIWEVEL